MVFVPLHCVPSFISGVLILILFRKFSRKNHKALAMAIIVFGIIGLIGYLSEGRIRFYPLDIFTFHAWTGLATFLLSIYIFINGFHLRRRHCHLGRIISFLASVALLTGLMLFFGLTFN